MSAAELASLRASLEEERASLVQRLADLGEGPDGALDFDPNFADSSQVTAERGNVEAVVGSLRDSLDDVEHALAKFDTGKFGLCEACNEPIAPDRLEFMPEARYCIEHASRRGKTASA